MYIQYNPNPSKNLVGDCVIRAITKVTNSDWKAVYMNIALAISREPISTSRAIVTPAAVDNYFNVTSTAIITVPKGCCFNVSVENVSEGATPADAGPQINVQNANMTVSRIA